MTLKVTLVRLVPPAWAATQVSSPPLPRSSLEVSISSREVWLKVRSQACRWPVTLNESRVLDFPSAPLISQLNSTGRGAKPDASHWTFIV